MSSFLYKNLGKNTTVRGPRSIQIVKSMFSDISKNSSTKLNFFRVIYNRRKLNEFEISKYTNKSIPSYLVSREPYIWLRNFNRHLFIMWDISSINPKTNKPSPIVNWATAIKYSNKSGASIISYLPPSPTSGTHIYKISVFEYPDNISYETKDSSPPDRHLALMDLYKFIKANNLKQIVKTSISVVKGVDMHKSTTLLSELVL